jgi:pimeloyl-ACP methyl ester carboxylesterase
MHSVSAGSTGPPVVMMPGYAAGSAFFFRNLRGLGSQARVFLVDWLGTGESLTRKNAFLHWTT